MKLKGIKYIGPVFDISGYAQAARDYIIALHRKGIPITVTPVTFEGNKADCGEKGRIIESLVNKSIDYNVVITHLTVEHYEKHYEPGKVNIGYSIWEANKIHDDWVRWINKYTDGVITATQWGVDVYKNSGVKVPIFAVSHIIDVDDYANIKPYGIGRVKPDAYKFYAIFQFFERKHPTALLKAYWYAFQNNENVALILKTYRAGFNDQEKDVVRNTIKRLKQVMPMDNYPPTYLILDRLSNAEILGIHKACDCLVHVDRGEGWGLVPAAAGAVGNPVIVTGWGGVLDYVNNETGYLINHTLTPVFGMPWSPYYKGDQLWAEPDIYHAAQLMRHVYNNREEAKQKGLALQKHLRENFNYYVIGNRFLNAVNNILKSK